MRHITLKDIAAKLGISYSTVSRALADDKHISSDTRQLVQRTAREMGYRPNPIATNLKKGRTNMIGVIVPEMLTPYSATVVAGIQEVCFHARQRVIIINADGSPQREREGLDLMESFMVDGIIIDQVDYRENQDVISHLREMGMPIVCYDRLQPDIDVSQVRIDDYGKACELLEHLITLGRKSIVHLVGPDSIYNSVERRRAYHDVMTRHNMPIEEYFMHGKELSSLEGETIADRLIAAGKPFDAVYAFTDTLAIGVMNRLRQLGKRIPEDVAITGFSGSRLSELVYPQLTTVAPPLNEVGVTCAQLILEKIKNPDLPTQNITIEADAVFRASTEG